MTPTTWPPALRLIDPAPVAVVDRLPVGEATELAGAVVRVLPQRHGWDAWDIATMAMDLDPLQPSLLLAAEMPLSPRPRAGASSSRG